IFLAVLSGLAIGLGIEAQNSNRKIRPEPSALAAKAGSAIHWRRDLEAALAESARSGKALFWYLPALSGSRMDRKPEIDRYMMAGPFSWPGVIDLLDRHTIPLRHVPDKAEQARFSVAPGGFIEPGFLILDPKGKELLRVDKLSTFSPSWFQRRLEICLGVKARPASAVTSGVWNAFAAGDLDSALQLATVASREAETAADRAEAGYLLAAALFRSRREEEAYAQWRKLGKELPQQAWSYKAMAEAEGHGPFVRGFEVYEEIAPEILDRLHAGSQAAPGSFDEEQLWKSGLRFLLQMQRKDGSYVDCRYDFGGTDSLPNVYVAVSAIAAQALWFASRREELPAFEPKVLDDLIDYLCDDSNLNPEDSDELVWAHIYRARFFCNWLAAESEHPKREQVEAALLRITGGLIAMQPESGAWYHEYPNPFVIASVLITLRAASESGVDVPPEVIDRGVRALVACRASSGAFSYGYRPGSAERTKVAAAAGRMPLAEHSLSLWGHGKDGALESALNAAFEHHQHMEDVRKYDDHANALGYGGFFFWYDMHARSEAILHMPAGEARTALIGRQRGMIMDLPEIDACFVDSHELGRVYGTAMALICLQLLEN
ncbi:MAG: prenyltransferase/squalene oxidase repeat-containing protein, partial [Planctomycetota bacterium]